MRVARRGAVDDANWGIVAVSSIALVATSPGQTYIVSLFNESLREAIELHGGEGVTSRDGFSALSPDQQEQLLRFLRSL